MEVLPGPPVRLPCATAIALCETTPSFFWFSERKGKDGGKEPYSGVMCTVWMICMFSHHHVVPSVLLLAVPGRGISVCSTLDIGMQRPGVYSIDLSSPHGILLDRLPAFDANQARTRDTTRPRKSSLSYVKCHSRQLHRQLCSIYTSAIQ
ncbi:hypothetical protein EJ05DRAFT_477316 [Pseudovirgaria hyperparasitica]|uniref:Uncharacterized protein n=1 Tax=Pseudovirgaria hyperparasitica TaxID=470096 RepID=A0A6A6W584_9PEZI|nr:uncharacterized protein EJ05DRAFT_477316 [Pseudovirgaria hyperparasitica]KAF2757090.1 hypothetical protein EJ05DRAFT_477316 [Pseudovirgaria hyperparasitica]